MYLLALSHFRSGPRSLRAYHLLKERHLRTPKAKYLLAKCCLDLSKYSEAESVLTSDFFSNSSSRTSNSTNLTNSAQGQTNPNGQQQQQQQQHLFASQFAYNIPQQFNQPNHFHSSQPQYANPVAPSMFSHQQHFNTHQQYAPQYIQQIEQPAVADRSRLSFISKQIEQPPHPFLSSSSSFSPSFSSQSKPIVTKVVAESESDDEETKEYPDN